MKGKPPLPPYSEVLKEQKRAVMTKIVDDFIAQHHNDLRLDHLTKAQFQRD